MLSQGQASALPERIARRLEKLNIDTLNAIGRRVREIGQLTQSDTHKLQQMRTYHADIDRLIVEKGKIDLKNIQEIYEIFDIAAADNLERAKPLYDAVGVPFVEYEYNKPLQQWVEALARQTADTYANLSQTAAFMTYDAQGNKIFTDLSETYKNIIDDAVTAVSTGISDYKSAMRKNLKDLADSGIRTKYQPLKGPAGKAVSYASGYSRRLDTAVRQNVLWGIKECNLGIQEQLSETLGADGYEIDYHKNPRPSHAPMGGEQFVVGLPRRIKGKYYQSFEEKAEPFLMEYGCLHFKTPILCGVSVPNWNAAQLREMKAQDTETFEYEGKSYTGYEATQMQRKLETKIRHAKDRQNIAKAAGDDLLRRQEQSKINGLLFEYQRFSDAAGLSYKKYRMSVNNYHKVKTNEEVFAGYFKDRFAANGLPVKSITAHTVDRAIQRGVPIEKIADALTSPVHIDKIKTDSRGRHSQRFVGQSATVNINPDTGTVVTVWRTGSREIKKYEGGKKNEAAF